MQRSTDRILSSHIGSLPRTPAALEVLRARNEDRDIDDELFETTIVEAVAEVVRRQADAGVTVVNDGEQSKWAYMAYARDRLAGFELVQMSPDTPSALPLEAESNDFPVFYERWPYTKGSQSLRQHVCTGPLWFRAPRRSRSRHRQPRSRGSRRRRRRPVHDRDLAHDGVVVAERALPRSGQLSARVVRRDGRGVFEDRGGGHRRTDRFS